jgi:hypothetical protein
MALRNICWVAVGLALGCQDGVAGSERCTEVTAQIDQAVLDYTNGGLLLPGADPCGLTLDSFHPLTTDESVEYLLGAFGDACEAQAEACWGVPRPQRPASTTAPSLPLPPSAPPPYYGAPD